MDIMTLDKCYSCNEQFTMTYNSGDRIKNKVYRTLR